MATRWPDTASTTDPTNTGAVIAARSHAAFGYCAAGVAVAGERRDEHATEPSERRMSRWPDPIPARAAN